MTLTKTFINGLLDKYNGDLYRCRLREAEILLEPQTPETHIEYWRNRGHIEELQDYIKLLSNCRKSLK